MLYRFNTAECPDARGTNLPLLGLQRAEVAAQPDGSRYAVRKYMRYLKLSLCAENHLYLEAIYLHFQTIRMPATPLNFNLLKPLIASK